MGAIAGVAVAGTVAAALAVLLGALALALPVVAVLVWWLVRHPLPLLVCFLSIGVFKGTPFLQALPVDITLALGLLLAGVCASRLLQGRALTAPLAFTGVFALIGCMLLVSLLWTPALAYGGEKAEKFWTLTLLAAFAPFFLIETERDLRVLLGWLVAAAAVGAVVTVAFGEVGAVADINNANTGRLEFGGVENTIFNARLLCLGVIVAVFAPALRLGGRWRWAVPVLGVALLAVAASIGSRGPLISLVFALAVAVVALVVRNPRAARPLLVLALLGGALLPFVSLPETSVARLRGIAEDPVGVFQGDGRSQLYRLAVDLSKQSPVLGRGAGGFSVDAAVLARKELRYPHNIFLELASELGIFVALAFLASIVALVVGLLDRGFSAPTQRSRMLVLVVTGLLLFMLFAAQFSGDINDNRTLWTMMGLGWLVVRHGIPGAEAPLPTTIDGRAVRGPN